MIKKRGGEGGINNDGPHAPRTRSPSGYTGVGRAALAGSTLRSTPAAASHSTRPSSSPIGLESSRDRLRATHPGPFATSGDSFFLLFYAHARKALAKTSSLLHNRSRYMSIFCSNLRGCSCMLKKFPFFSCCDKFHPKFPNYLTVKNFINNLSIEL